LYFEYYLLNINNILSFIKKIIISFINNMEAIIAVSIIGLGYLFQNNTEYNKKKKLSASKNQKPNGPNIYTSNRAYEIFQNEQKQANVLMDKSLYPTETNVVTPGPPFPIMYDKVDYADNQLPIEFNSYTKYDDVLINTAEIRKTETPVNKSRNNESQPISGGWSGISLTGDVIDPNKFTHNNQQPFFGGSIKQNVDEFSTTSIFENFTGQKENYKKKQELGPLFQPQKNMANVYGTQTQDGFLLDRYYVSNIRSNETPIEKVYVGPGLNQGYTSQPSGGFQQADSQDYSMPKTVDEFRVKTKPKMSYFGRVVSGQKIAKPTKIGTVYKNKPDTFFINEPDRYFTTTGAVTAPEQRPCIITKYTNRKTTELKTRQGSAAPVHGSVAQVRSKYKISDKITYTTDGPRNIDSSGQWSIMGMLGLGGDKTPNDYGKNAIKLKNTNRIETGQKTVVINKKPIGEKGMSRNGQKSKLTKKQTTIDNEYNSNLVGHNAGVVYDPNDIPKATIKESQIHNTHSGYMNTDGQKGIVYDPDDIARTTIKETNIHNTHTGYMNSSNQKGVVYDPNDLPKTTIKETNIHNSYSGALSSFIKGWVKDPTDGPRITIKETTSKNRRSANVSSTQKNSYIKNKEPARMTIKETTMANNIIGIATQGRGDGHIVTDIQVPDTIRQDSSVYYVGDATGPESGGYNVTEVNAPDTLRQSTSDIEYYGGAGNGGESKAMSYEDIYNAEIKAMRGDQDSGYTPGPMGPSQGVEPGNINLTTSKIGDIQNKYIQERGVQSNKVYNSIPQIVPCNITQTKEIVPNEPLADRINPAILDAFKTNPYSQSLASWA
jgi:hypothetical protein